MKRLITALALTAAMMIVMAPAALADGAATDQERKEAAGWGCGGAVGLPDGHCISPGTTKNFGTIAAKGGTFQLQVFDVDGSFLTAEIATFSASADGRPCPNDTSARPAWDVDDGTYWEFIDDVLWVCHHQPG